VQFRQKALSRLQSPEELDVPVRLARPRGRLALAVTAIVVAGAGFWAVTGTIAAKVSAAGVLTHGQGGYLLQSPLAGQVTGVFAHEGDRLALGAPVLSLMTADKKAQTVPMGASGRVTALWVRVGAPVTVGASLATVERMKNPGDPLMAVLYLPQSGGPAVPVGAPVELTVQSVPVQQFGVLRGHVQQVGTTPETQAQIAGFLGDSRLAEQLSARGTTVPVLVRLDASAATKSGLAWSSAGGPPFQLQSATLVSGDVYARSKHPIDWVLP
jgi:biotin carboxyl carrier protein